MKRALLAVTVLALGCAAFGQSRAPRSTTATSDQAALERKLGYVGNASIDATSTCTYTFTSGTGLKYLKYCVTKNGNIVQFASPQGIEYIGLAPKGEGYGMCDFDSSTQYFDYAGYGDSGNWQAPVKVSSSATSVQIKRTTHDGLYTLTQTITQDAANALAKVSMSVKNNDSSVHHIGLLRYADVDANSNPNNDFDYTFHTAFGNTNAGYGLELQHVSGGALNGGFTQDAPGGPNPCQFFTQVIGPIASEDGSIFMQYDITLAAGVTKAVVVNYKAF
ncbi:MAG: hypothetical protein WB755_26665 [Terriglobales bacterium]